MTRLLLCTSFLALACACPETSWIGERPSDAVSFALTVCLDPSLGEEGRKLVTPAVQEWDHALGGLTLALRDAPLGTEGCDVSIDEQSDVPVELVAKYGSDVAGRAYDPGDVTKWRRVTFYTGRFEGCYRAALHELGHVFGVAHTEHGLMAPVGGDCGHVDQEAASLAAEALGLAEFSWKVAR